MEYVTLESYDGKMVRVPVDKKAEYIKTQQKIRVYIEEGKTKEEIKELLKNE